MSKEDMLQDFYFIVTIEVVVYQAKSGEIGAESLEYCKYSHVLAKYLAFSDLDLSTNWPFLTSGGGGTFASLPSSSYISCILYYFLVFTLQISFNGITTTHHCPCCH